MRGAYYRMAWGLLFVLADFRFEYVDVLPDMLGYLMIASGLWRLQRENGYFRAGHLAAWLLLIWALVSLFLLPEAELNSSRLQSPVGMPVHLPSVILYMVLVYGICQGIAAHFAAKAGAEVGGKARFRLHLFLAMQTLWLMMYPFLLNIDQNVMIPMIFIFSIGMMAVEISIIFLLRLAGREWKEEMEG